MPGHSDHKATARRKREHVDIVLARDVAFRSKSAGFEKWEFEHNALPEIDLADVDTGVEFLGKRLALPLMVSCMTGGYTRARNINEDLAVVCEEQSIAMGVGSQRQALEGTKFHKTFAIVRTIAPTIPVIGNIGAAEVGQLQDASPVQRLVDMIRADAFAVHLNPLQEFLQPEGTPNFRGVMKGIELLVEKLSVPVIVKEIGAGISARVARRLIDAGVRIIDVAGAGGTSWAGVEILRSNARHSKEAFWDWGIPTVDALRQIAPMKSRVRDLVLIASGGVANGVHVAKSLALGADLAASARPIIQAWNAEGRKGVRNLIELWARELRGVMFLVGARKISQLKKTKLHPVI